MEITSEVVTAVGTTVHGEGVVTTVAAADLVDGVDLVDVPVDDLVGEGDLVGEAEEVGGVEVLISMIILR